MNRWVKSNRLGMIQVYYGGKNLLEIITTSTRVERFEATYTRKANCALAQHTEENQKLARKKKTCIIVQYFYRNKGILVMSHSS